MQTEQIITFNIIIFYIIFLTHTRVFEVRASKLHYYRSIFYYIIYIKLHLLIILSIRVLLYYSYLYLYIGSLILIQ